MRGYLASLRLHAQNTAPQALPRDSLETRFVNWFDSLPEFTRNRPFSMSEFENALGTQGKHLSPVLLRLGWVRKRRWNSRGQYHRYWLPFSYRSP